MENKIKRIGYLPRKRVLEIIDDISKSESISRSKVVGILVEEALDARGIANFGYSNTSKSNLYNSDEHKDVQNEKHDGSPIMHMAFNMHNDHLVPLHLTPSVSILHASLNEIRSDKNNPNNRDIVKYITESHTCSIFK